MSVLSTLPIGGGSLSAPIFITDQCFPHFAYCLRTRLFFGLYMVETEIDSPQDDGPMKRKKNLDTTSTPVGSRREETGVLSDIN